MKTKTCLECGYIRAVDEDRTCEYCNDTVIGAGLVTRLLYESGAYEDVRFCKWKCVAEWVRRLVTVTTASYGVLLPVIEFDARDDFWKAMREAEKANNTGKVVPQVEYILTEEQLRIARALWETNGQQEEKAIAPMMAGSARAILHEVRTGTLWTVADEVLHSKIFDWLVGDCGWRWRFCQWAHRDDCIDAGDG